MEPKILLMDEPFSGWLPTTWMRRYYVLLSDCVVMLTNRPPPTISDISQVVE